MLRIKVIENRKNGARFDGFVTDAELSSLEGLQSYGGFKRFSIDVYETIAGKSNYSALKAMIFREIL